MQYNTVKITNVITITWLCKNNVFLSVHFFIQKEIIQFIVFILQFHMVYFTDKNMYKYSKIMLIWSLFRIE